MFHGMKVLGAQVRRPISNPGSHERGEEGTLYTQLPSDLQVPGVHRWGEDNPNTHRTKESQAPDLLPV